MAVVCCVHFSFCYTAAALCASDRNEYQFGYVEKIGTTADRSLCVRQSSGQQKKTAPQFRPHHGDVIYSRVNADVDGECLGPVHRLDGKCDPCMARN